MKKILTLALSVGCLYSLLFLSGCVDILGINTSYAPFCTGTITLDGPASISIDPCDVPEITYNVIFNGDNLTDPDNKVDWGFKWIVEGDFDVISAPSNGPLVIKPSINPKDLNHSGTITLMGQVDGDCKAEGDSGLRTLVYEEIPITLSSLSIDLHLCQTESSQIVGSITAADTGIPLPQKYNWTIAYYTSGNPQPTIELYTTASIDITKIDIDALDITLQRDNSSCTPIEMKISRKDLPFCGASN